MSALPSLERLRCLTLPRGQGAAEARPKLAFGVPAIDQTLPQQGLAFAALHEFLGDAGALAGFLTTLASRSQVPVFWLAREALLYAPGLMQLGLDHRRLTIVSTPRLADRLWTAEEILRSLSGSIVIAEIERADLTATRRLQLAAEKQGGMGLLIRSDRAPSAALTRWQVKPASSDGNCPRWRLTLERCRAAPSGFSWDVEWDHATLSFHLATPLADGSLAAAE